MSYKLTPTTYFEKQLKKLSKKYPKLKDDLVQFAKDFEKNLATSDGLGKNCYKIRLAITGKPAGKSGGARIIAQVFIQDSEAFLLSIYDKADIGTITERELDKLISKI